MRFLLDTHTLLWFTLGDSKLSDNARNLIIDASNEILISAATVWEIAIKINIGKLSIYQPYDDFINACMRRYGFGLLPIEPRHTSRVSSLPFPADHRDPFDRVLVAQALVEDIPIVGSDVSFDHYPVKRFW